MSTSSNSNPRREYPSTYFVQDRSNVDEMVRLQIQDELVTAAMGGPLPEQPDTARFHRVLDVGCGTGHWLIEAARLYPGISQLVGVDVSARVIEYARTQAAAHQVDDRVDFRTMDALRLLEFPNESFDLVNQRSGAGYLRTWDWPNLLREYVRVTIPGGMLRITEGDWVIESNSPALTQLLELLMATFYEAGHSFTLSSDGVTSQLERLLLQYGLQDVQKRRNTSTYHGNTAEGKLTFENMKLVFRNIAPFMRKWIRVPDNYEEIYQQMIQEMQQPDFVGTGSTLTVWGTKPE